MTIYIHYGTNSYDKNKFKDIKNRYLMSKPLGGLWASEVNDAYGWKQWCEDNDYNMFSINKSFKFKLKKESNIVTINKVEDLEKLPKIETEFNLWITLDFEKLVSLGVDAIKLNLSNDIRLYQALYGWDCDSILIMNKECIELIK